MIHTQTQIDNLIELAIIQRVELRKLVESLPELRTHLSVEIERNLNEIEPAMREELQAYLLTASQSEHAILGNSLKQKIAELAVSLEDTTAQKYSVLMNERAENDRLLIKAEARIAEAAIALPSAVKEIVLDELSRFPRANQIDQLRKEFAEPASLNPRGKWQIGETYNKLDLVSINGNSFIANETTSEKPTMNSTAWTLNSSKGGVGAGITSITELTGTPSNGETLIGNGQDYVKATLTAGNGISITNGAGSITVTATGGVNFQGSWNASTNTPTLTSSVGTTGFFYIVSVAGSTNLNGITDWEVGDWAIFGTSTWTKVDNTDKVSSVFGRVGSVVGVSTDYSGVGITNTALGASNPSTVAATTLSSSSTTTLNGTTIPANKTLVVTTDKLSALAATTSAELAGVISDETGSGALVFATSPTLVTPALGTPSALVGTNISGTAANLTAGSVSTNANLTGVITSVGNATSIASQTGTGSKFVVDTSPTLVTPNLGTPSAVVLTNASGTAASLTAGNVTTNANLTGDVTSVGNATSIASGVIVNADVNSSAAIAYSKLNLATSIVNADISASAAIVDTKLATISTALKVSNSATTAASANTASAIVARDASGNFSAGTISAALTGNVTGNVSGSSGSTTGNASTATALATGRTIAITGDLAYTSPSFDGTGNVTAAGTLASVASAGTSGGSTAIPVVTINAKGLTTSITTAAVIAPAGTLSGNTLASGVTASSLTSLGTIANLAVTAGTISGTPSASTDIANKLYVDTVAQGLDAKASCIAATTVNITLSGTQTIDGISVIAADRVLVKNQTLSQNNGIYLCAAGAWTRTTDADTWDELTSAFTFIETGTVNADTGYVCTANAGGTLGTTALPWSQFSGAGSYTASTGLTLTGTVFSLTAPVTVALGGTNATSAGIAAFNNISGYTAAGATGTTSTNLVFSTSPTLITPALGTPTAIVLTSATGLPLTTGVTGTLPVANGGTGVTTSTGTTNVVLSGSPTITTPVIAQINDASGNETLKLASIASAVNEVTIENAATGNAVHISATGGDASVGLHLAGKGASGYVNVQDSTDASKRIMFNASGGTTNTRTMLSSTQTVDRTLSLPDATDTLVGKATTDTLTNKTLTSPTITGGALNGTLGATTPSTVAGTTISGTGAITTSYADASELAGYSVTNTTLGGYGGAVRYYGKQNFGANALIEAGRLQFVGASSWSDAATTLSNLSVKLAVAGTLTQVGLFTQTGLNSTAIGATTPSTGAFTTGTFSSTLGVTGVATLGNGAILGTPASGTLTNCTIPASALTGATLAAGVTASSLTSLGTIAALSAGTGTFTRGSAGQVLSLLSGNVAQSPYVSIGRASEDARVTIAAAINDGVTGSAVGDIIYGSNANSWIGIAGSGVAKFTSTGLNSTVIGATTPAAGSFTTLSATGLMSMVDARWTTIGNTLDIQSNPAALGVATIGFNTAGTIGTGSTFIWGNSTALTMSAPTGGHIYGRINNSTVTDLTSTGLAVTGLISATTTVKATTEFHAVSPTNTGSASFRSAFTTCGVDLANSTDTSGVAFINFRKADSTAIGSINRVALTNAVVYNTTSDARLKENFRDFTDSGRLIDALKPRVFDWKDSDSKDVIGFIAQEEHAADPVFAHIGAVSVGDDDPTTITKQWQRSDAALIPILVAELQSLRKRLAALESK